MKIRQFDKLSLKELRSMQQRVNSAIAAREHQEKADLKKKLAEMADKAGFNVGELFGAGRKARGPVAVKYRHPENASLTWTGRGRRPTWLAKAGGDIERFRV